MSKIFDSKINEINIELRGPNEIVVAQTVEIINDLANEKSEIKEFTQRIRDDVTVDLLAQFSEALRKKYKCFLIEDSCHALGAKYLNSKRKLAQRYQKAFEKVDGVRFHLESKDTRCNYWLNVLLLDEKFSSERESILKITNDNGIMTRPAWRLLPKLQMFKKFPKMNLNVAESLERCLVNLPSSPSLI